MEVEVGPSGDNAMITGSPAKLQKCAPLVILKIDWERGAFAQELQALQFS
jgi:hypothetical protein